MIFPNEVQSHEKVALHYNSLDLWYRRLWGEHLHHGLWKSGKETSLEAVERLVELVAGTAELKQGEKVCDIGCGYGATARLLTERWKADVTGFSLSEKQLAYARSKESSVSYQLRDWLKNDLPPDSFDLAISIESSEHMTDKEKFFQEAYRVLKPGGRLVVCAWLSREKPRPWEIRHFLEPICREGRLPSLGSPNDYRALMRGAGFSDPAYTDLTSQVKKTWAVCAWRMLKALGKKEFRHFLFQGNTADRIFAKTALRIWGAYQTRSMIYGIFRADKK